MLSFVTLQGDGQHDTFYLRFTQHDLGSGYNPVIPLVVKTIFLEHNLSLKRLFEVYLAQNRELFFENFNFSYENLEIVSYCLSL